MSEKLLSLIQCRSLEETDIYKNILEEAGFEVTIVETKGERISRIFEVSVAESDYDEAFKIIEAYEEG